MNDIIDQPAEPTPQEKFRDALMDRLSEDMTQLMPEEMLASIVEQGVKAVLEQRPESKFSHQTQPTYLETRVQNMVRGAVEGAVRKELKKRVPDIEKRVMEVIPEVINHSLGAIVCGVISQSITNDSVSLMEAIQTRFNQPTVQYGIS